MRLIFIVLLFMVCIIPEQNAFTGEKVMDLVVIETDLGNIVLELEETAEGP